MTSVRPRRAYDHRLREHVSRTGARALSRRLDIPRSTVATWRQRGLRPVVTAEVFGSNREQLVARIEKLDQRVRILAAIVRLVLSLLRASGFRLDRERLPEGMVLAPEHRHMPLGTLALYAQRIGKVLASASTWARLVRQRVYPAKPTLGVRATRPNEIWHIDVTILRLVDGTKAYVHAVIDNFSRKILAWTIAARLEPAATCNVLLAAAKHLVVAATPTVYADSGVENVNTAVDATLLTACLNRVLAQVEVAFSNSMIEAFWRSMKHGWLYLNSLDTIERLRALVEFFVQSHNTEMPHPAFHGHTPDETYFGTAPKLADELAAARTNALDKRLVTNRAASCGQCSPGTPASPAPEIPP